MAHGRKNDKRAWQNGARLAATVLGAVVLLLSHAASDGRAAGRKPDPRNRVEDYSLTRGEPIPIPAREAKLPFSVYGDGEGTQSFFVPSGYMGDNTSLKITAIYDGCPVVPGRTIRSCLKIRYAPKGAAGWAGVYWLTPANNWAKVKGAGFNLTGAERLSFWARGETGQEIIAEFKMGGITGAYPDSDMASLGTVHLTSQWRQYDIDLHGKDLRHIIGGFAFVLRRSDNRRGATFYLSRIMFEGATEPVAEAPEISTVTVAAAAPLPEPTVPTLTEAIRKTVLFGTANQTFDPEARRVLLETADLAKTYPKSRLRVEGHTDDIGPADVNMTLSRARASAVADFFAAQGVARDRITVIGYGETRPISADSNKTSEGRRKNRRVDLVVSPGERP